MQFPWSAVVGQEALKRALILCAIDPAIGGVLVHGPRGVAKTTLARALAELVPGKFVELPLGATEERVTGAIDLERALQAGQVEFAPGLLARAHEGVLYVDEVNLLPDALVDLLLDAAATGRNVVERDGVSHAHPARFVLVGSMNPEEGELRPQLLDRFGLSASAEGVIPPLERAEIVTRRLAFDRDPEAFRARYAAEQQALVDRCKRARASAARIELGGAALAMVTERCHAAGVEGVRADLAMLRAVRAHAAWSGREAITIEDVDAVAELALAHRRPKGEGEPPGGGGRGGAPSSGSGRPHAAADGGGARRTSASEGEGGQERGTAEPHASLREERADRPQHERGERGRVAARPVQAVALRDLPAWLTPSRGKRAARHRRGVARAVSGSGTRARSADNQGAIDWFATLSRAAFRRAASRADARPLEEEGGAQQGRDEGVSQRLERDEGVSQPLERDEGVSQRLERDEGVSQPLERDDRTSAFAADTRGRASTAVALRAAAPRVLRSDVRYRARRAPSSQLWILAVDCSASMVRSGGLAVAKGFAHAIEAGARRAGARLAVVSFRGGEARLEVDSSPGRAVLPRAIAALGGGGGTPLRAALVAAGSLCKQTRWRGAGVFTRLLVLTDARVRDPRGSVPPLPRNLERIVVDCERGRTRLGRARQLTAALHGVYYRPTHAPVAGGLSVTRPSAAHTTRSV